MLITTKGVQQDEFEDTKGVIRIRISKKNIQHNVQKRYQKCNQHLYIKEEHATQWSKDTKGVIIIRISKKSIQHNGQKVPTV